MLSDEEKKAIEEMGLIIEAFYDFPNPQSIDFNDKDVKYLETILNLIDKQQKEIAECQDALTNTISKHKIKAKIEECREILYSFEKELELKANKNKFIHKESMNCLLGQISILQSLLEEE